MKDRNSPNDTCLLVKTKSYSDEWYCWHLWFCEQNKLYVLA